MNPSATDRAFAGTIPQIYDRYLRYQMVAAVYRGEVAAVEHRRLLDAALKRDWKTAQATLDKHVRDCVSHMIEKRLVR